MVSVALWLEGLLICSLWAALVDACFARCSRGWRWAALGIGLMPLAFPVALLVFAGRAELKAKIPLHLFQPLLSLTVLALATTGVLWLVGFSHRDGRLPAASWPRFNLAMALTACAVLLLGSLGILESSVKRQAAVLRQEAETLSISLAPPVADRDNAAPTYEAVYKSLATEGNQPHILDVTYNTLSPFVASGSPVDPQSPELAAYLKGHVAQLTLLRAAAARPICRFPHEYALMTFDTPLPEILGCRRLTSLLLAEARHRAATGDLHVALADIQAVYALGRHIAKGPHLALLVGIVTENEVADNLEGILQSDTVSSSDLDLLELEPGATFRELLPESWLFDEAMGTRSFASFMTEGKLEERTGGGSQRLSWLSQYVLMPVDCAGYRRTADDAVASINGTRKYDLIVKEIDRIAAAPPSGMLSENFRTVVQSVFPNAVRCDAHMAAMQTGVAMHRYRAAHGQFPATRDELAAEFVIPTDPFDGKPIRFKTTDHGWIVYSVGPDLIDDGGKRYDPSEQKGDIVFEYRGGK